MSTSVTTEPTAFARFRAGEHAAFDDFVREYSAPAHAVATKVLKDQALAEEAVQEAFLRVWRSASRFEHARGSERTWILSVVRNQAIDMLRRRMRQSTVDIDAVPAVATVQDGNDPWAATLRNFEAREIQHALQQLPGPQRGVIQLAYFGGMRSVDIARSLNVPEGTVRSRMRLGLARMREHLQHAPLLASA